MSLALFKNKSGWNFCFHLRGLLLRRCKQGTVIYVPLISQYTEQEVYGKLFLDVYYMPYLSSMKWFVWCPFKDMLFEFIACWVFFWLLIFALSCAGNSKSGLPPSDVERYAHSPFLSPFYIIWTIIQAGYNYKFNLLCNFYCLSL